MVLLEGIHHLVHRDHFPHTEQSLGLPTHPLRPLWKNVWNCDTFENNFRIKQKIMKYLKESCKVASFQYFSFKYFPKYASIWNISPQ